MTGEIEGDGKVAGRDRKTKRAARGSALQAAYTAQEKAKTRLREGGGGKPSSSLKESQRGDVRPDSVRAEACPDGSHVKLEQRRANGEARGKVHGTEKAGVRAPGGAVEAPRGRSERRGQEKAMLIYNSVQMRSGTGVGSSSEVGSNCRNRSI